MAHTNRVTLKVAVLKDIKDFVLLLILLRCPIVGFFTSAEVAERIGEAV